MIFVVLDDHGLITRLTSLPRNCSRIDHVLLLSMIDSAFWDRSHIVIQADPVTGSDDVRYAGPHGIVVLLADHRYVSAVLPGLYSVVPVTGIDDTDPDTPNNCLITFSVSSYFHSPKCVYLTRQLRSMIYFAGR